MGNFLVTCYNINPMIFTVLKSLGARNLAAAASALMDGWVFIVTSPAPRDTSAEIAKTSVTAKTEHLATTSPVSFRKSALQNSRNSKCVSDVFRIAQEEGFCVVLKLIDWRGRMLRGCCKDISPVFPSSLFPFSKSRPHFYFRCCIGGHALYLRLC